MKVTLRKSGQIYIPKSIRNEINLEIGVCMNIFLDGKKIVLTNKEGYEKENKCTLSQNGAVHIPSEIRKLRKINSQSVFNIFYDAKKRA